MLFMEQIKLSALVVVNSVEVLAKQLFSDLRNHLAKRWNIEQLEVESDRGVGDAHILPV